MRCDGHIKLTSEAIRRLQTSCQHSAEICNPPMLHPIPRRWHKPLVSNSVDNGLTAWQWFIGSGSHKPDVFDRGNLANQVMAVDLNAATRWTHDHPLGQRYHFMRAPGETSHLAYLNATRFIEENARAWVHAFKRVLLLKAPEHSPMRLEAVDKLALAVHCLQDSFSPSHVRRAFVMSALNFPLHLDIELSNPNRVPPIRELFVYAQQNHDRHAEEDYASGSLHNSHGELAVAATVDFLKMCQQSAVRPSFALVGWEGFKQKWLAVADLEQ
ncbi:MAG: hypothetical protein KDD51_08470 [Bdellovibrionales bacterium]|nr:hypothetical protein [Bdellovibrionales bacterium]